MTFILKYDYVTIFKWRNAAFAFPQGVTWSKSPIIINVGLSKFTG